MADGLTALASSAVRPAMKAHCDTLLAIRGHSGNGFRGGSSPPAGQKNNKRMDRQMFMKDDVRGQLVSKDALIKGGIFTEVSYRSQKSRRRLEEIVLNQGRWVLLDSLTDVTRRKVRAAFATLTSGYEQQLLAVDAVGEDCTPLAVEFTADSLVISEPFVRATIESYMRTHYSAFSWAYLDAGLSAESVKGYAKQCALVEWIYNFIQDIKHREADPKRLRLLLRSFRVNLLTAMANIVLEVKIPLSETRFNAWLDGILSAMDAGKKPEELIKIKRAANRNGGKVTDEQFKIAVSFYLNGVNMSVQQVYNKWLAYGRRAGWWSDGEFNPPTEGRLYQLLKPIKNAAALEKTDDIQYMLHKTPAVSRDLPTQKNLVWEIDGTAHNENAEYKRKVKQHVYVIKVLDAATMRMVGVAPLIGVREPFWALKEAILMGIRETGYKPSIIHCDRGPAFRELEAWGEENGIKIYPSNVGNARAKLIESSFNQFDNAITRYLKGYSGQNRTTRGINSRASEKRETAGKRTARSASIIMQWLKNEGLHAWNEHVIETLEGKPCGKTPYELWAEKESATPKLDRINLCTLCGTPHRVKFTINGLTLAHEGIEYVYFPAIETPEQRAAAAELFNRIPLDDRTSAANRMTAYVLEGGEPAAVFDNDGAYVGMWGLKTRVGYIDESGELGKFMALSYRVKEQAKAFNEEIKQTIERHDDRDAIEMLGEEMLTGRRRVFAGRYDKSALLEEEIEEKASEELELHKSTPEYREYVDPDTGEIYRKSI